MLRGRSTWLRGFGLAIALGMLISGPAGPQATTVISNVQVPVDLDPDPDVTVTEFFDPCLGETVRLEGSLHIVVKSTHDAKGVLHVHHTHNPQGVRAVGLQSGLVFRGNGGTRFQFTTKETGPFQFAFHNVFHLVGPGQAPNLRVFDKLYFTLDEDGNVLGVFLDQLSITCS